MIKFIEWLRLREENEPSDSSNSGIDTSSNTNSEIKQAYSSQCCSKDFKNWYYSKKKRRKN
jgi:hypothetical protein